MSAAERIRAAYDPGSELRQQLVEAVWKRAQEIDAVWAGAPNPREYLDATLAALQPTLDELLAEMKADKARCVRLEAALRGCQNAYGCFAGCTGALPGGPADGSGHTPTCRAAREALEETGGSL